MILFCFDIKLRWMSEIRITLHPFCCILFLCLCVCVVSNGNERCWRSVRSDFQFSAYLCKVMAFNITKCHMRIEFIYVKCISLVIFNSWRCTFRFLPWVHSKTYNKFIHLMLFTFIYSYSRLHFSVTFNSFCFCCVVAVCTERKGMCKCILLD